MRPSADPLLAIYFPRPPDHSWASPQFTQSGRFQLHSLIRKAFLTYCLATLGSSGGGVSSSLLSAGFEIKGLRPDQITGSSPEAARLDAMAPHGLGRGIGPLSARTNADHVW